MKAKSTSEIVWTIWPQMKLWDHCQPVYKATNVYLLCFIHLVVLDVQKELVFYTDLFLTDSFGSGKLFLISQKIRVCLRYIKQTHHKLFFVRKKNSKFFTLFKNLYNCISLSESDYLDRYCIEYQYVEFIFVFYLVSNLSLT